LANICSPWNQPRPSEPITISVRSGRGRRGEKKFHITVLMWCYKYYLMESHRVSFA
jgi:hypothetical protein